MESMDRILAGKGFAKCNSCERICRPWHLHAIYIPLEGRSGSRTAKGCCPHCMTLADYSIRDYTDEEISSIPDIIKIKLSENRIDKEIVDRFRKKPVVVEAIQWNGNSNKQEIINFVGKELKSELESETAYVAGKGAPIFSLLIETKEGVMKAFKGDWIIKEPFPTGDRDFYPCKPDIFEATYEREE